MATHSEQGHLYAKELDYKVLSSSFPSYRMSKLIQQSGGQTASIPINGDAESIFEIPTKCINLAKSTLSYTRTVIAQAAYSRTYEDTYGEIRQIVLYTCGGQY